MNPEDYLDLPYRITLTHDRDENGNQGWVAEVPDLPGCVSQGRTPNEAIKRVRDAMLGWISIVLEDGGEVPEPREPASHSGRVLVRMPRSLHTRLVELADDDGVSLNHLIVAVLAYRAGMRDHATA